MKSLAEAIEDGARGLYQERRTDGMGHQAAIDSALPVLADVLMTERGMGVEEAEKEARAILVRVSKER